MDFNQYIELMEQRLMKNFDIKRNSKILNEIFPLFAKMEMQNEKYFAAKGVKIWRAENSEFLFIKEFEKISEQDINDFQQFLIKAVSELVKPHSEHMSSTITGVMVTNQFPIELEKPVKRFKYRKSYALSFKGWADIKLILVDLSLNKVITNNLAKKVDKFYLPSMEDK